MKKISRDLIKELRIMTGAGMMDCKNALIKSGCDVDKALYELKKQGLVIATKKMHKIAAEGLINSYIHIGNKIGILIELNCETDFVARRQEFHDLSKNISMQLAAYPNIQYIDIEDIPMEVKNREKDLELCKIDLRDKPIEIVEKIVEGRLQKTLKSITLLNQEYIRDNSITVGDLIKLNIAKLGENIKVKRFVRFVLGE